MKKHLSIIPLPDPRLVPRYLLEQVKDRNWSVDEWYDLQVKLIGVDSNLILSLIDREHSIAGLIWLTIDAFDKHIYINTFSVDKKHQGKSKLIKFVSRYIKELGKSLGIHRILWTARRARALKRYGFQESDYKLFEEGVQ